MASFSDQVTIILRSGRGGDGHVSFRREKYVPNGGPDGGDGGRGGDVIFCVDPGVNTLGDFRHRRTYAAGNGAEGGKKRCHGADGADVILSVPEGTVVTEAATGRIIADMSGECRRAVILRGGKGGLGNQHFATSSMQAPKYAQPGGEAVELEVRLELKLLADVGLCGLPNAGKSTLLSAVSNARPKIADYPFTTLTPQLGVVDFGDSGGFVMADIPGLIEGASEGIGLGHAFLRHIERTRLLLQLVDCSDMEGQDPIADVATVLGELSAYERGLEKKPRILVATKLDACADPKGMLSRLSDAFSEEVIDIRGISSVTGEGVCELMGFVRQQLASLPKETQVFSIEFDPMADLGAQEEPVIIEETSPGLFEVYGPRVERMLGYTNLESEKGFAFFQKFMKEQGVYDRLADMGASEGDTVSVCGLEFEYLP